jgi:cold shock CspA family protein
MTEVNKKVNLDNPVDTGSSSKQRSRSAAKEIEKLILGRAPRPGAQLNARAAHKATPNKRSRAGLGASSRVLRGTVSVNPRGFGFVTSEDGGDAFIPPKLVTDSRLVDGDIVRVLCYSEQDRLTVTKINEVTQTRTRLFGVAQRISAGWVLRSDPWLSSLSAPRT